MSEGGILLKIIDCPDTYKVATFHRLMMLRAGQRMFLACFPNFQPLAEPKGIRWTEIVRVESSSISHMPRVSASVAQRYGDTLIGLARRDPNGGPHGSSAKF